ncbi:MAG: SDR family NAD(P)-dependent oxidoreductase [Planctomycetaceae bacterium]|jgi:short-subunit dehydrogenase|nr:SDR family NAD(P)-dependent oxidoreductase [Planctomycetaceae bacterium]
MKRSLNNSRILLTGASSGIGAALAFELAKENANLVLLARRENRLQEVVERIRNKFGNTPKIITVVGDITNSEIRRLAVQTVTEQLGGLDILINNAGAGATALIEATTGETLRRIFEVNFFAPVELTQLALPYLKLGNKPMVVNLSSIVGLRGAPHYGAYGAAKFAVSGISETMRAEFSHDGIDVLLVCPGTTQTEFFDVLYQSSSAPNMPVHHAVTSEYVANRIVWAMKKGKHKIIPYFQAVILDYLNRFVPQFTDWIMTKYVK